MNIPNDEKKMICNGCKFFIAKGTKKGWCYFDPLNVFEIKEACEFELLKKTLEE